MDIFCYRFCNSEEKLSIIYIYISHMKKMHQFKEKKNLTRHAILLIRKCYIGKCSYYFKDKVYLSSLKLYRKLSILVKSSITSDRTAN